MTMKRIDYLQTLFPNGIPTLWCPPLTHFTEDRSLDERRMEAHLRFLAPSVKGLLVPGTTGEGWELSDSEASALLRLVLPIAGKLDMLVLVGILKPTVAETLTALERTLDELELSAGDPRLLERLAGMHIAGFTFCAPRGAELSQQTILQALRLPLERGLPSALYQLPQVTANEFAPETARELAASFENLILIKDSSGGDRIITSPPRPEDLFFVRGAEGDYYEWFAENSSRYDGFLLSTANSFPVQLARIVAPGADAGEARRLSQAITAVINESFNAVRPVNRGNLFTNANKAIDHFNAYGPQADKLPGPRLHDGTVIPAEVLSQVGTVLTRHGLMPERGYYVNR